MAAAISTAFNAPVAGIVFAHEVILRHYSLRAFAPITVAATMGYVVANVVFERSPLFRVEAVSVGFAPEFPGFILMRGGHASQCPVEPEEVPVSEFGLRPHSGGRRSANPATPS